MTRIANYTLHSIETGTFGLDGGAMFGVIPKPLWERKIPADSRNRIRLSMRCLLLEGEGRLILIDNGIGTKYDSKFASIYAIETQSSDLVRSLNEKGFDPVDITDVILTHLHFDHCGGSTRREGERLSVTFPGARFSVQMEQWRSAHAPNPRERGSFLAENLEPLASSGQLDLVDGDRELAPNVFVQTFNGHTDMMQLVRIADAERALVFAADLLPTRFHLAPAWTMAYDMRPLVSMDEKSAFLHMAAEEGWHLFFEHDADVEVASLASGPRGPEVTEPRPLYEL